jgi:hypothetical protein
MESNKITVEIKFNLEVSEETALEDLKKIMDSDLPGDLKQLFIHKILTALANERSSTERESDSETE